jgi:hypothetical protein
MTILVWVCKSCSKKCILPFSGTKNSCGFERPDFCVNDICCETGPWVLKKVDEIHVLDYFRNSYEKWEAKEKT